MNQKPTEYFNTQDIGELTPTGNLILKGRSKNLIIYPSGDKIFCEDMEYLANQLTEISESCLTNLDEKNPKLILAVVGNPEFQTLNLKDLKSKISQKLPIFVYLQQVVLYPKTLPKTHTLKLNRKTIRDWIILNSNSNSS